MFFISFDYYASDRPFITGLIAFIASVIASVIAGVLLCPTFYLYFSSRTFPHQHKCYRNSFRKYSPSGIIMDRYLSLTDYEIYDPKIDGVTEVAFQKIYSNYIIKTLPSFKRFKVIDLDIINELCSLIEDIWSVVRDESDDEKLDFFNFLISNRDKYKYEKLVDLKQSYFRKRYGTYNG